jgi:hypothetical protein
MKQSPTSDDVITKAQLAREVGLSRQRIGQMCDQGLPVLPSGRLDRTQALRWIEAHRLAWLGGWEMRPKRGSRRMDIPLRMPPLVSAKDWDELDRDLADMRQVPEFRGELNKHSRTGRIKPRRLKQRQSQFVL